MSDRRGAYDRALSVAHEHAKAWIDSVDERAVPPRATVDEMSALVGGEPRRAWAFRGKQLSTAVDGLR